MILRHDRGILPAAAVRRKLPPAPERARREARALHQSGANRKRKERRELTVNVVEGRLAAEGERKHEIEEEKNNWYKRERTCGRSYRTVPLPTAKGVTPHKVEVHAPDEKVTVAS